VTIDTIFSLSSGQGRAGVAVIRISGPASDMVGLALAGRLPEPRRAVLLHLYDPVTGVLLDQALVLRFLAGASFTGESSWELHVHGGRAVVKAILDALAAQPGLRAAEAGEFTRRALMHDRLDLAQVEALADLIDADTEHQRRQALRGLEGALGLAVRDWRSAIVDIKALIAAEIDFSDEGDVGENAASGIDSHLKQLEVHFRSALAGGKAGRIVSEGFRVALVGPPNAGKSTLLNRMAGADIAIVTEYAGTTRDLLEVRLDLDGFPVVMIDMAGLRDGAADPVERIGISRAQAAAARADLLLLLDDGLSPPLTLPAELQGIKSIRIRSKSDLYMDERAEPLLPISALTGDGIDHLHERILAELRAISDFSEPSLVTRERQRIAIERALQFCVDARHSIEQGIEFVDSDVQRMDAALSQVLGIVDVEEVLGAVFSRFCVGK
jgi:tRNA modification GTPase